MADRAHGCPTRPVRTTTVAPMRRLCERPGCTGAADVSYGMDSGALLVWLDNSNVPDREHAGRLCRRHADALTVPKGWTIDDRRVAIPQLFRVVEGEQSEPRVPGRRRAQGSRQGIRAEDDTPTFFDDTADAPSTDTTPDAEAPVEIAGAPFEDPDETKAIPWSPRLVPTADPDDDQPRMGRLMGRAFRQKRASE